MNQKIKIGLYVALLIGAVVFGALFYSNYKRVNNPPAATNYSPMQVSTVMTNATAVSTNVVVTNDLSAPTNQLTETSSVPSLATNPAPTNVAVAPAPATTPTAVTTARTPTTGRSAMIGYLFAFLATAIFLGLIAARDISEFFGNRSVDFLFNDEGTGIKNPEYEEAEQEWANGHHLEAIRLMRDYLNRNPREQYVALRIAEIYEKDLKNYLAAVLEYEEILKHKLAPDRWGWAAIHLCNLYSKMQKTDEAVALLRRIVSEYGETPAAEKARKRLAMFETVGEEALDGELPESIHAAAADVSKSQSDSPASSLPPGFRPKK